MNNLSRVDRLANRFSIMRHGQSKANARGIIVSCIANDRRGDYGLSELGRQQVLAAARDCGLPGNTVICSSDFSRARQTAELVRAHLGAHEVVIAEALRERCFGDWEGSAAGNYARVWAADEANACQADGNVEPATAVLDRVTAFVVDLERRYSGRDILLVSHGDTLQILRTGFLRMNPSRHRNLPELKIAEICQLRLDAHKPASVHLPESSGPSPVLLCLAGSGSVTALIDVAVDLVDVAVDLGKHLAMTLSPTTRPGAAFAEYEPIST